MLGATGMLGPTRYADSGAGQLLLQLPRRVLSNSLCELMVAPVCLFQQGTR